MEHDCDHASVHLPEARETPLLSVFIEHSARASPMTCFPHARRRIASEIALRKYPA
jgi:hypothetical protein